MKLINLQTFSVKRALAILPDIGYYLDNGDYFSPDQTSDPIAIQGNLQPITGRDLELLPEGFKRTDIRKLFTKTELYTVNEDTGTAADCVTLPDGDYQVQTVEPWIGRRLSHFKVILVKKEKS